MMSNKDVDDLEEDIIEVNSERSIGMKQCNQISAVIKVAVINRMSEGWMTVNIFFSYGWNFIFKEIFFQRAKNYNKDLFKLVQCHFYFKAFKNHQFDSLI